MTTRSRSPSLIALLMLPARLGAEEEMVDDHIPLLRIMLLEGGHIHRASDVGAAVAYEQSNLVLAFSE